MEIRPSTAGDSKYAAGGEPFGMGLAGGCWDDGWRVAFVDPPFPRFLMADFRVIDG